MCLKADLNQKSRNILRATAVGIERMPKVRVSESGEVGEPPDSSIRHRCITMTEMRHMSADMLDALLRLLFRDRRGEDAIVLSTDVNKNGKRERESFINCGGAHLIIAATNTLAQHPVEAEKWLSLRPVCFFMPTGNNDDYSGKRATSRLDGKVSAADRNMSKLPPGAEMERLCAVLSMSSTVAGGVIGLMQQVGLLAVEIHQTKKELVTWLGHTINSMFTWVLHPKINKGNFTRVHRVCVARAMADHAVDRVLCSFANNTEFNAAFDEATYALETDCIEPAGLVKLTHTALRQSIDLQFLTLTNAMVTELKIPVVPFQWLLDTVAAGETNFHSENATKIREWIWSIQAKNMFITSTTNTEGPKRATPYVSSPATQHGNVKDDRESMLRVDNVSFAPGADASIIAASLMKHLSKFMHASNVDNEIRNIIPALNSHQIKICEFDALFDMKEVLNVRFFLGIFFSETELRQLPEGIFTECLDNKPTVGRFSRVDKPVEGAQAYTAYGIHVVVGIIIASFMGNDTPVSCEINTVVASKVIEIIARQAPASILHPSGTHLNLRGFTGKNVRACELEVEPRVDKVQSSFFMRMRNDTSLQNAIATLSIQDSPMRPYLAEDVLHCQWISFLEKNHNTLFQQWDKLCLAKGACVFGRSIKVNDNLDNVVLSDLYRTLDAKLLPCDDTLLYGVSYPVIGVGEVHTTDLDTFKTTLGYVLCEDANDSRIHIFKREADVVEEAPFEDSSDDDEGDMFIRESTTVQKRGDTGCDAKTSHVATASVYNALRERQMIVMPLIARPSALVYCADIQRYGTLAFNLETGQCYDRSTGKYTLRVVSGGAQDTMDMSVDASANSINGVSEYFLDPLQVERGLISVPTALYVDSRAFIDSDGRMDTRLETGAGCQTYIRGFLWYPNSQAEYETDIVYLLVKEFGPTSSRYTIMRSRVEWVVHPEDVIKAWNVVSAARRSV